MKLVNITGDDVIPRFVNPNSVDAVICDGSGTIIYAGQFSGYVKMHYTEVIKALTEESEDGEQK